MGMASEQDGNVAGVRGENVFHLVACCVGEPNSKEGEFESRKKLQIFSTFSTVWPHC